MRKLFCTAAMTLSLLTAERAWGQQVKPPVELPTQVKVPQLPTNLLPAIPPPVINQNSFFSAPAVRDQLRLTEQQFTQMNSAWTEAFKKYETEARNLTSLDEKDRAKAMLEASANFNRNFGQATAGIMNAQQQMQFNQLTSQLSGLSFLSGQNLAGKLNLSDAQQAQLQKATAGFNERIAKLDWSNPQRAIVGYHAMLPELRKAMNEVLTDEQRAVWNLVYGQSFNFTSVEATPNR